jgi:hypothetical protein
MHEELQPQRNPTMSKELQNRATILNSAELKELLGPAPVLTTENAKAYDEILSRLMLCYAPRDFMDQLLIKQLADSTWEIMRYMRHKTLGIERKSRQSRELQALRAKTRTERISKLRGDRQPATEIGRLYELENTVENTVADVDEILENPEEELQHARALEENVAYYLQLDQLHNAAIVRRDDTLEQLERYRNGYGRRPRKASGEIIDAEFNDSVQETKDVGQSLVPSSEDSR